MTGEWTHGPALPITVDTRFTSLVAAEKLIAPSVVFRVKAVRGELFALLTLAVTFVVATIILNTPIDGGPGIYLNAVAIPKIGPTAQLRFSTVCRSALALPSCASGTRFGTPA